MSEGEVLKEEEGVVEGGEGGEEKVVLPKELEDVPDVLIDEKGVFKYILMEASVENEDGEKGSKMVVVGHEWAGYHVELLEHYIEEWKPKFPSVKLRCRGGGRIQRDEASGISVYGYSVGFGRADHSITTKILRKQFPDESVGWSNDGY